MTDKEIEEIKELEQLFEEAVDDKRHQKRISNRIKYIKDNATTRESFKKLEYEMFRVFKINEIVNFIEKVFSKITR